MERQGKCAGPKYLVKKGGRWRKVHMGGHDMMRRVDTQGEALIWCRKCSSGHARGRLGPKLMNCCKPETMGTTEYGKILERIQVLEEGRISAKEKCWKTEMPHLKKTEINCGHMKLWHEENFLSSWLREDLEGREAEMERLSEEAKQAESKSGKREVEKEKGGNQQNVCESGV